MNNLIYRIIFLNFELFLETGFLNFFGGAFTNCDFWWMAYQPQYNTCLKMPVEGCWLIPKNYGTDKMGPFQKSKNIFLHLIVRHKKKNFNFFC
jgi:hypothetical protein